MATWPDNTPLLTAGSLRSLTGEPGLLIVDCRHELGNPDSGKQAYRAGHIPGAVFASIDEDLAAPRGPLSGRHPLPTPQHFANALARWGFTPTSRVVAYDQGNGMWAARLWWMLRARGHLRVQVLDGGLPAWQAAGGGMTVDDPHAHPTRVDAQPFGGAVSSDEVVALLAAQAITLVDARPADRFAGRNETVDPVAGHVPGAISMPATGNVGADQRFLPGDDLRARWTGVVARAAGAPIVAMCGSGVSACHNLLALELAGFRGARLYAGSFSEWITNPARPVATGE